MYKYTIGIEGMRCDRCESHINEAIRKIGGIKMVKASHLANNAIVISDNKIDEDTFKKAITAQGYGFLSFKEEPYEKKSIFSFFKK